MLRRNVSFSLLSLIILACMMAFQANAAGPPNKSCKHAVKFAADVTEGEPVVGLVILTSSGIRICNSGATVGSGKNQVKAGACTVGEGNCKIPWGGSPEAEIDFSWATLSKGQMPDGYCNKDDDPECTWNEDEGSTHEVVRLFSGSSPDDIEWVCYEIVIGGTAYQVCSPVVTPSLAAK